MAPAGVNERASFHGSLTNLPDFTIKIKGYEFKAHSCVLASKSHFFRAIFEGSNWKENKEKSVQLGDDPFTFGRALIWFYYDYYSWSASQRAICPTRGDVVDKDAVGCGPTLLDVLAASDKSDASPTHGQVTTEQLVSYMDGFALADKYMVDELKVYLVNQMRSQIKHSSISQVVDAFSQHMTLFESEETLKRLVATFVVENFTGIRRLNDQQSCKLLEWMETDKVFCLTIMDEFAAALIVARTIAKECKDGPANRRPRLRR